MPDDDDDDRCCPHARSDHEESENATHPCLLCECEDWKASR